MSLRAGFLIRYGNFLLVLAALGVFPIHAEPAVPTHYENEYPYPNRLSPVFKYDLEDLMEMVQSRKISSIEELIPALPEAFKKRYIMMYRSRSLQQASFLAPRVLLLGEDGSFVMTFNGEARQRGHDKLELMQFRPETASFEFRELEFIEGQPKLSEANPAKCLRCHQSPQRKGVDPRPNWEPYNIWPGAYGSMDGALESKPREYKRKQFEKNPADLLIYEQSLLEPDQLKKFEAEIKPSHPRYSHLLPYKPHITVEATMYFANLNFRRVTRLLSENLDWEKYKWLLTLSMYEFGCGTNDEKVFKKALGSLYPLFFKRYQQTHPELKGEEISFRKVSPIVDFLMLPLDVDTSDWSMDFKTEARLAFSDRFGTPNNPRSDMNRAMVAMYPELKKISCKKIDEDLTSIFDAAYLEEQRRHFLERMTEGAKKSREPRSVSDLLQLCVRCHVQDEDPLSALAPRIPFDNFAQLAVKLEEPGYPRGTLRDEMIFRVGSHASIFDQMPPDESLQSQEMDGLTRFIKDLKVD